MEDMRSRVGDEIDRLLAPKRISWITVIVIMSALYIGVHLIVWAARGYAVDTSAGTVIQS